MIHELEADPSSGNATSSGPSPIRRASQSSTRPPSCDGFAQARGRIDPDGSDSAFDRMILIGHSMGGLLAKLMVQDSRSLLWEVRSPQPLELVGPPEAREMLRQAVFFKSCPGVRRIIFIATPHRGSRLDRGHHPPVGTRLVRCGLPEARL